MVWKITHSQVTVCAFLHLPARSFACLPTWLSNWECSSGTKHAHKSGGGSVKRKRYLSKTVVNQIKYKRKNTKLDGNVAACHEDDTSNFPVFNFFLLVS